MLLLAGSALAADPDPMALLQAGKRQEALQAADAIIAAHPADPASALYLSALINLEDGNWQAALPNAEALVKLRPGALLAREVMVQAYAAAGDTDQRDDAINALFRVWRSSTDPATRERQVFTRDRIAGPNFRLIALQTLQTGGEDFVRYIFRPATAEAQPSHLIILRTDSGTTQRWRDDGTVPYDAMVFHLDTIEQLPGGEQNIRVYEFFTREPSYDQVKAKVAAILDGTAQPLSGKADPFWTAGK